MRRALLAGLLVALVAPLGASARTTHIYLLPNWMPKPYFARGDYLFVGAENFLPHALCHKKASFKFIDSSGKILLKTSITPKFNEVVQGEAYPVNLGAIPYNTAFGKATIKSRQHCSVGTASGKTHLTMLDVLGDRPLFTVNSVSDTLGGGVSTLKFTLDKGAAITAWVEWEFLPGNWQEIAHIQRYLSYIHAGSFNEKWRAKVGSAVPPGHYRFVTEVRALATPLDSDPLTTVKTEFSVGSELGKGQLTGAIDGQVNHAGSLIVADSGGNRLQAFDSFGAQLGTFQPGLQRPSDIAFGADDTMYVCDRSNSRVAHLAANGGFLSSFGSAGSGPGQFSAGHGPQGIAATSLNGGRLYVVDGDLPRIQAFDFAGTLKSTISGGGLNDPISVAVAGDGSLWVADPTTRKVFHFSAAGAALGSISVSSPWAVEVDPAGRVLVTDLSGKDVQVYGGTGTLITTIGNGLLDHPGGLAAWGTAGDFAVVDQTRVVHFRLPG